MGLISKVVDKVEKGETAPEVGSPPTAPEVPRVPARNQTPASSGEKKQLVVLLVICLVIAGLSACGYVFLMRPSSEAPGQPTRESISSRRQKLKSIRTAPTKKAGAQPQKAKEKSPAELRKQKLDRSSPGEGALKTEATKGLVRAPGLPARPGGYTIQLLASPDGPTAQDLASRVISDGYGAYVQKVHIPGKGTVFRVRVGAYASRLEAQALMAEIAHKYDTEAWIDYYVPPAQGSQERLRASHDETPVSAQPQGKAAPVDSREGEQENFGRRSSEVRSETEVLSPPGETKTAKTGETAAFQVTTPSGSAKREETISEPTSSDVEAKAGPQRKVGAPTASKAKQVQSAKEALNQVLNSKEPASEKGLAVTDRSDSRAQRYCNKGVSYQREGKLESAADSYRKALTFSPDHKQARLNLATAYMQMGRLKQAEQELTYLYALKPEDPGILYNLALLHYKLGEYTSAEAKLQDLLELDPLHLEANLLASSIYEAWGEEEKALAFCMDAHRINSADSRVLYRLGRMLDGAGQTQEAVKYYRLFLKSGSEAESGLKLAVRNRLNYLVSQQGEAR